MSGAPTLAYHCTVQVQDETEVQVLANNSGVGLGGKAPTLNIATAPAGDLVVETSRSRLSLRYSPLLTARALEQGFALDALQQGALDLSWHDRRTRVSLDEQASYGTINYATVLPGNAATGATTPLQALPPNTVLTTASSRSTLAVTEQITRRASITLSGGYAMSGGANADSRTILPFQRGPIARGHAELAITRRDGVVADADYAHADFTATPCTDAPTLFGATTGALCNPHVDAGSLVVGFRHRIERTASLTLEAGAAGVGLRHDNGASNVMKVYPVTIATLDKTEGSALSRTEAAITVRVAPIIAQQTGAADLRAQGDVTVDHKVQRFLARAVVRASQSIPATDPGAYFDAYVEAGAGYQVSRRVTFFAGERLDWQRIHAGPSLLASLTFVRIQVTSPVTKF